MNLNDLYAITPTSQSYLRSCGTRFKVSSAAEKGKPRKGEQKIFSEDC